MLRKLNGINCILCIPRKLSSNLEVGTMKNIKNRNYLPINLKIGI